MVVRNNKRIRKRRYPHDDMMIMRVLQKLIKRDHFGSDIVSEEEINRCHD